MFEQRVAGGRFEGVGTVANIFAYHWAAVYISKTEKTVEYFDPQGSPPYFSLEKLLGTLAVRVGREVGGSAFKVLISKGVHLSGHVLSVLWRVGKPGIVSWLDPYSSLPNL
jgi:hypothetical protein